MHATHTTRAHAAAENDHVDGLPAGQLFCAIAMEEAGRDLASVPVTIWGAKEDEDLLKRDRDDGVARIIVSVDSAKADRILPELDRWARLLRAVA